MTKRGSLEKRSLTRDRGFESCSLQQRVHCEPAASGSEVSLVVAAHEALASQGIRSRVVSMPSWDIFEHQPQSYRESVLPTEIKARIAVEQGSALGWDRYVGAAGRVIAVVERRQHRR